MFKISNDIIGLSLEKDTDRTPISTIFYLFKDGKIIDQGRNFKQLNQKYNKIIEENKVLILEATKEAREAKVENQTVLKNWLNSVSNNSLLGGSTIKTSSNKRYSKTK